MVNFYHAWTDGKSTCDEYPGGNRVRAGWAKKPLNTLAHPAATLEGPRTEQRVEAHPLSWRTYHAKPQWQPRMTAHTAAGWHALREEAATRGWHALSEEAATRDWHALREEAATRGWHALREETATRGWHALREETATVKRACLRCSIAHKCATSLSLLRRLAGKNIHILHLSVVAEKQAQLLIPAPHRYPPDEQLVLRISVGLSPIGNIAPGVREPHLVLVREK